jgi:DNA polymerase III delta prime subunit
MIENVWQEYYRPKTVSSVVSIHTPKILNMLKDPMQMQNLLMHSRVGGTGKSSMATAIIKDLGCDVLMLNASKDRSIEIVRSNVTDFCVSKSSVPNVKRCVWMDEFEKLSKDAMDALKNMIEIYSKNVFFLATTNDINKIPQPIQSRFNVLEFSSPEKSQVRDYLIQICKDQELIYDIEAIEKLVQQEYPSIRAMVNKLQDLYIAGRDIIPENIFPESEMYDKIWAMIKSFDFKGVKQIIYEKGIDCKSLNRHLYYKVAYDEDLPLVKEIKILQTLARNERDFNLGAQDVVVFVPSVAEIIMVLK